MIRRLVADDAAGGSDEIARLLEASFDSAAQRWSAASVADTLAVRGTIALLAPSACAILRVAADEAEILTIAVLPEVRRQGRATLLARACIAEAVASGATSIHLEVAASNAAARALYRSAGFAEAGVRRGYYQGPRGREDAVLMRRERLSPSASPDPG